MADCTNFAVESQPRTGLIYLITNTVNGMNYVGQTIQKLSVCLRQHKNGKDQLIDKAIQKYGWENFTHEVLEENIPREMLDEREIFWIAKLNTKIPNGYNLTDGGDSAKGKQSSKETCAKISATLKAKGIKPPPRTGQEP